MAGPILKVLTRDTDSRRVREIKPSELTEDSVKVESLWDVIHNSQTQFVFFNEKREVMERLPKNLLYNDIDALEDQILFPEETPGTENSLLAEGKANVLSKLEREGPDMDRFVYDLDTDEEVPGSDVEDDDEHDLSDGTFGNEDEDWENAGDEDDLDMKNIKEDENPISDELKTFISHFMKYHDSIPQDEKEMFEQYGKFI